MDSIQTLLVTLGGSAVVAAIVSFTIKAFGPQAVLEASTLEHLAYDGFASFELPDALKALITAELHSLASDPAAVGDTVEAAAAKILAKVAPQFPATTIGDVSHVIGQIAMAFVSGLATDTTPKVAPAK